MYGPLNEYVMIQETNDRIARAGQDRRGTENLPNRRWWRKAAAVAR